MRCRGCGAVYVNPLEKAPFNYFDMRRFDHLPGEEQLMTEDFHRLLEQLQSEYLVAEGVPLTRTLLVGKFLPAFGHGSLAERTGLRVAEISDRLLEDLAARSDIRRLLPLLDEEPQVVILHELLEACSDPAGVVDAVAQKLPPSIWFVVTYTNVSSFSARLLRRHWSPFFSSKSNFLSTGHLGILFARQGFELSMQWPLPKRHTAAYIGQQVAPALVSAAPFLRDGRFGRLTTQVRVGNRVALFRQKAHVGRHQEKLTVIMPIYNEAHYCADVVEAVLAKDLPVEKEVIIVESNSTDGSREIVEKFAGRPGVRLILEEAPQGKGHAVRVGLAAATGTIIMIQDADFEYDIDDYDALLEPILQHKAHFVLGSRTLGLDDWKVRRFGEDHLKSLLMNTAQVLFAKTYNALYQQKVTDVNTMFKVFRSACLSQFKLESDGFELDIELACKLARTGYAPMEVPVNYVARGFSEGKKIRFFHDFFRSYFAFMKYRLAR